MSAETETIEITCSNCGKSYQIPKYQLGVWCDCFIDNGNPGSPVFVPNPLKPVIFLAGSVLEKVEKLAELCGVSVDRVVSQLLLENLKLFDEGKLRVEMKL